MTAFDPYYKWLAIPPAEQPPNLYRLLGVTLFESDVDVIEAAADQRMAHVRTFQSGQYSGLSQKLLNELSAARLCLIRPEKKVEYDNFLRGNSAPASAFPLPPNEYATTSQAGSVETGTAGNSVAETDADFISALASPSAGPPPLPSSSARVSQPSPIGQRKPISAPVLMVVGPIIGVAVVVIAVLVFNLRDEADDAKEASASTTHKDVIVGNRLGLTPTPSDQIHGPTEARRPLMRSALQSPIRPNSVAPPISTEGQWPGNTSKIATPVDPAQDSSGKIPASGQKPSTEFPSVPIVKEIGNSAGGAPFRQVPGDGNVLVGISATVVPFGGSSRILKSIQPIFERPNGSRWDGAVQGPVDRLPIRIEAKPGYSVARIIGKTGDRIDSLQIVFTRLQDGHVDSSDSYLSEWIGVPATDLLKQISDDSMRPAVGLAGRSGSDVDAVSLIYSAEVEPSPPSAVGATIKLSFDREETLEQIAIADEIPKDAQLQFTILEPATKVEESKAKVKTVQRLLLSESPRVEVVIEVRKGGSGACVIKVSPWLGTRTQGIPCNLTRMQQMVTNFPVQIQNAQSSLDATRDEIAGLENQLNAIVEAGPGSGPFGLVQQQTSIRGIKSHLSTLYGRQSSLGRSIDRWTGQLAELPGDIDVVRRLVGTKVQCRLFYVEDGKEINVGVADNSRKSK